MESIDTANDISILDSRTAGRKIGALILLAGVDDVAIDEGTARCVVRFDSIYIRFVVIIRIFVVIHVIPRPVNEIVAPVGSVLLFALMIMRIHIKRASTQR
jgi:hypothetical protein